MVTGMTAHPGYAGAVHPPAHTYAGESVATLGPHGTDAYAEAQKYFGNVVLMPTFEEAMHYAHQHGTYALVAAGFSSRSPLGVGDMWVDMHFRNYGRMRMAGVWESHTKPMCVATNTALAATPEDMKTIALHPATRAFGQAYAPWATPTYADAKPIAAQWAAQGVADGCIGSVDVVQSHPELAVHDVFHPTMVWCLYQPVLSSAPACVL